MSSNDTRSKLIRFYQKHKPEKESDVEQVMALMDEAGMTEHELFDALCKKYNVAYDPLEWKAPVIGKGTINGAAVELHADPSSPTVTRCTGLASVSAPSLPSTASLGVSNTTVAASTGNILPPAPTMDRREMLTAFYKNYNPTKLCDVDRIIELSDDSTNEELLTTLCKKYNLPKKTVFNKVGLPLADDASTVSSRPNTGVSHNQLRDQLQHARPRDEGEDILRKEFAEWISRTMSLSPPLTSDNLFQHLSDGTLLCKLLLKLNPNLRLNYSKKPGIVFQKLENVKQFLEVAEREFKVPKEQLFDPQDLVYEERDKRQVMTLFLFVAKTAHQMFSTAAPQIVKLELEIEKEDVNEITNEEVEEMLRQQKEEKVPQGPSEEELREERERQERQRRKEEEEEKRKEAEARARREAYERERRAKEAELRRLQEQRKLVELERLRKEEERRRAQHERRMAAEEEERRRRAEERAQRMRAQCLEEDNPVFQYKGNMYVADRRDPLDVQVGRVVNSLPSRPLGVKMHKVKNGMYIIEYPKRIMFFVRCLRGTVMIRVGGGWATLEEFLHRRLRDYPETFPVNMIHERTGAVAVLHHRDRLF